MVTLTAITLAIGSFAAPAEAASQKTKAFKTYKKYLEQKELKAEYGQGLYDDTFASKNAYFAVAYIDNNSIPELLVKYTKDGNGGGINNAGQIRTYKNGKSYFINTLGDYKGMSRLYKKTGLILSVQSDEMGGYMAGYYKLPKGGTSIMKLKAIRGYDSKTKKSSYLTEKKEVNAKAYKVYVNKLKKGVKSTKIVWHKNTAKNRRKYLK